MLCAGSTLLIFILLGTANTCFQADFLITPVNFYWWQLPQHLFFNRCQALDWLSQEMFLCGTLTLSLTSTNLCNIQGIIYSYHQRQQPSTYLSIHLSENIDCVPVLCHGQCQLLERETMSNLYSKCSPSRLTMRKIIFVTKINGNSASSLKVFHLLVLKQI